MDIYFGIFGSPSNKTLSKLIDERAEKEKELKKIDLNKKIKESAFFKKISLLYNVDINTYKYFELTESLTNSILEQNNNILNNIELKGTGISNDIFYGFVKLWKRYIDLYKLNNSTNVNWRSLFYDNDDSYEDTFNVDDRGQIIDVADKSLGVMFGYIFKYGNLYKQFKEFAIRTETDAYAYIGIDNLPEVWGHAANVETYDGFKYLYKYSNNTGYNGQINEYLNNIINLANIRLEHDKTIFDDNIITYKNFYENTNSLVNNYINNVLSDFAEYDPTYKALTEKEQQDLRNLLYLYASYCNEFIIKHNTINNDVIELAGEINELNNNINILNNEIEDINEQISIIYSSSDNNASILVRPQAKSSLKYNGENQQLIEPGTANNGEVQYSLDGNNFSNNIPVGKNAQVYTVYYKAVGNEGFGDSRKYSVNVTISKAPPASVNIIMSNWEYGHLRPTPDFEVNEGSVIDINNLNRKWEYKLVDAPDSEYTTTQPMNVGSYIIRLTILETNNCSATTATKTFSITENTTTYYWYAGQVDPKGTTEIIPVEELELADIEDANTYYKTGWRSIGKSLTPNYIFNTTEHPLVSDGEMIQSAWYFALPNNCQLGLYDAIGNEYTNNTPLQNEDPTKPYLIINDVRYNVWNVHTGIKFNSFIIKLKNNN